MRTPVGLQLLVSWLTYRRFQGPQVYQSKFGPTYKVSYATSIGLLSVTVVNILATWWLVKRQERVLARQCRPF